MTERFAGKAVVIRGASTGIGSATTKRLVKEQGGSCLHNGRRKDSLDRAVMETIRSLMSRRPIDRDRSACRRSRLMARK